MGGWGGRASNKYTFRKASQLRFRKSCFPKDSQVQNACTSASFRKYALQKKLGFASFTSRIMSLQAFASFSTLSQIQFCTAKFRKVSISHSFAKFRKVSQIDFRNDRESRRVRKSWFKFLARFLNGHFADVV